MPTESAFHQYSVCRFEDGLTTVSDPAGKTNWQIATMDDTRAPTDVSGVHNALNHIFFDMWVRPFILGPIQKLCGDGWSGNAHLLQ
jgi:hypothetical protein